MSNKRSFFTSVENKILSFEVKQKSRLALDKESQAYIDKIKSKLNRLETSCIGLHEYINFVLKEIAPELESGMWSYLGYEKSLVSNLHDLLQSINSTYNLEELESFDRSEFAVYPNDRKSRIVFALK